MARASARVYDAFRAMGIEESAAMKAAEEIADAGGDNGALKLEIVNLRSDMKQENSALRAEMATLSGSLRAEMATLSGRLTLVHWMVGANTALTILVLGTLLLPH